MSGYPWDQKNFMQENFGLLFRSLEMGKMAEKMKMAHGPKWGQKRSQKW